MDGVKISDVRVVEVFSNGEHKALSVRISTDHRTREFRNFGFDEVFPLDAKKLAKLLRQTADELDQANA